MTDRIPEGLRAPATKRTGPAPGRIVAAAASVAAGIGLVTLMAGGQQEIVVQVNPTPIVVEVGAAEVRVVEPATEAPQAIQAKAVTQSEGS